MIYNMTKQIYSSEIGKNGYLKTLGLINLIQDCENLHINSLEKFNNFLNEHQVGVFLNYRQVHIIRRPEVLEWVKLKTWPYETKGFLGYRNTLMFDSNNEVLMKSYCLGTFINISTNRFVRLPNDIVESIGQYESYSDMPYYGRHIEIHQADDVEQKNDFVVRRVHIDTYQHMNNSFYVTFAEDLIPDFDYNMIRVEYKHAVKEGETLTPYVYKYSDKYVITLNKGDIISCIIEFSKER